MIRLAFLGDVAFNDALVTRLKTHGMEAILDGVPHAIGSCDSVMANLEACWDVDGTALPCGYSGKIHVRTEPAIMDVLERVRVNVVSSANNHAFDFGDRGWDALRAHAAARGIRYVGEAGGKEDGE